MAEAGEDAARPFLSGLRRGDRGPGEFKRWLVSNGPTIVVLFFIFVLALFTRAYFGHDLAAENGYIVSGGSDSYYWQRIIDYSAKTGRQLYWDPLINYPEGIRNPRPPLFSMSVVVPAVFAQGLFSSLEDALGWMLMWSTAFWGALTVIPTYFLGKEVFGRRTGLVAAFFLAIMPSHVQRSVLSDADHDAIILFFIVLTFFFVLKAVKAQEQKRWVENWRSWPSIRAGLAGYFRDSRTAVLYALMAGTAFGSVIMTWVGFGYVAVLILAYYLIQVLFNRFRNIDSLGVTMIAFISMGFGYLISFPVYYEQSLIPVRFDVPVYLFLAAIVFGMLFVVSRDYPWTLTLPAIAVAFAIAILAIDIVNPALANAILSGQGYFVKNKLYSTIAEARAPRFSELALSFGMVTFFLSLAGLIWALLKVPKQKNADYIFVVVWLGAAIFMAISAGRFMFNAAPAFAIAAAWVLVLIVDRLDFNGVRKALSSTSGSPLQTIKKSIKVRHVAGALFLAFMVVLPNVWYGVDAGIPSELKPKMDKQIYFSVPGFMRPSSYDRYNGSNWYLGAFGYSLPLPKYYFPAAWSWFSRADADIQPAAERPAYVSWWDYGFEAVQAGQHPTVADNFQNGYQIAGNIIVAQSEDEAIALFAYRLLTYAVGRGGDMKAAAYSLLEKYGVSSERMEEILTGPAKPIKDAVLADPTTYGPMAPDLSDTNARIVAGRVELVKMGGERLVSFYSELCGITGMEIRYFSVDSRMFPRSGTDTGIFYAPAKLSDRRVKDGSTPYDFYEVKAKDQYGREIDLDQVTADTQIVDYVIQYKSMFFDSMFYRAFVGFSGSDIGQSEGIPGLTQALQQYSAAPGWNLSHFKMVYRTAYYNPYPVSELGKHRDAWRAVSLEEATVLKKRIEAGEIQGYVDDSSASYYMAGVVFLKYYAGAFVNGTVTTEDGRPVAGIRATIIDEYSIPHQTTLTDEDGRYSLLAPFGNVTVVFSTGDARNQRLIGPNVLARMQFTVTDDQAMRKPQDLDNDGVFDYIITKDYVLNGTETLGDVFWDLNQDGNYTANVDQLIPGAVVTAKDLATGRTFVINAADGTFDVPLPPGRYDFVASLQGRNVSTASDQTLHAGAKAVVKLPVKPATISGTVSTVRGLPVSGLRVQLSELQYGLAATAVTGEEGNFTFTKVLEGLYQVTTDEPGKMLFDVKVGASAGSTYNLDLTLLDESGLKCVVLREGKPVPYASYVLFDNYDPTVTYSGTADAFGVVDIKVPKGIWTMYATYFDGASHYVGMQLFDTGTTGAAQGTVSLAPALTLTGTLRNPSALPVRGEVVAFERVDGARVSITTNQQGAFSLRLPAGTYWLTSSSVSQATLVQKSVALTTSRNVQLMMSSGVLVEGVLWAEKDASNGLVAEDLGAGARIRATTSEGASFTTKGDRNGSFALVLPKEETVTLTLGEPGYAGWSQKASFSASTKDVGVIATPDKVTVSGRVTCAGVGVRGVTVVFEPGSFLGQVVTATTGAGGYYSATMPPGNYTVRVSQESSPMGGERYWFSGQLRVLPSGIPLTYDFSVSKKLLVYGMLFGASSDLRLRLDGPEELDLSLAGANYSAYVLPGAYRAYASGSVAGRPYANISLVEVTGPSTRADFELLEARELSGTVMMGSAHVTKPVEVRATSSTGEIVEATSDSAGSYSLVLPRGTYTVSFVLEDMYPSDGRLLYVEYFAEETVSIGSSDVTLSPSTTMRMDNVTFSGTVRGLEGAPVQAYVQLIARGIFGMNCSFVTAPTGAFNVSVQPGDYTLYVTRPVDRSVHLSQISISRNTPLSREIVLSEGRYITGVLRASGAPVASEVILQAGGAKLVARSDASGAFGFFVPTSQNYSLVSSATRVQKGLGVYYSGVSNFFVGQTDVFVELDMMRDTQHSVAARWDRALTQTALPGTTVRYVFTVENRGNIDDRYVVTYAGGLFDVSFNPSEFDLGFGTGNVTTVLVEITPKTNAPAGNTLLSCTVQSKILGSARAELKLYVDVAPWNGVSAKSLNTSEPVSSRSTLTYFNANNTGNIDDELYIEIVNADALSARGWSATIIDADTKEPVSHVKLAAFAGEDFAVRFVATRSDPDPNASADVLVYSGTNPSVSTYVSVPVLLPDLAIGPGTLDALRSDVSYRYDATALYTNIGLMVALVSLVAGFFILRKKKGLSGGGKK